MRVIVLGCGPAGMAAYHAALGLGHEVKIASKSWVPSELYGCQYLHEPIPGFEDVRQTRVHYRLIGTAEEYRRKVYGEDWQGKVSPEDFVGNHHAWDIRATYRRMWAEVDPRTTIISRVAEGNLSEIKSLDPEKIISTIPAPHLCHNALHKFSSHSIYARGSINADGLPRDHVMCVGDDTASWYRTSNVFGYRTVEWPSQEDNHPPDAVKVNKPLTTDCNCHPEVIRVGRYGTWRKSFLVHQVHAYLMKALR